jgi:hypothetical protein
VFAWEMAADLQPAELGDMVVQKCARATATLASHKTRQHLDPSSILGTLSSLYLSQS